MKWGLDLRGGVRFLMEVDMNSALAKRQEQLQDTLRNELRKEKNSVLRQLKNSDKFGTTVTLENADQMSKAARIIRQLHPTLEVSDIGDNTLNLAPF